MQMELERLLYLLEERLTYHNNNRKEIQNQLKIIRSEVISDANTLESKILSLINNNFAQLRERILRLIAGLNNKKDTNLNSLIKEAQEETLTEYDYRIEHSETEKIFSESYRIVFSKNKIDNEPQKSVDDNNKIELLINQLQAHYEKIHGKMTSAQSEISKICNSRRKEADELEKKIDSILEIFFLKEDFRINNITALIKRAISNESENVHNKEEQEEEKKELTIKAIKTLVSVKRYSLGGPFNVAKGRLCEQYSLTVTRERTLDFIDFGSKKISNFFAEFLGNKELSISFNLFSCEEIDVLKMYGMKVNVALMISEKVNKGMMRTLSRECAVGGGAEDLSFRDVFVKDTVYCVRMRIDSKGLSTPWSDLIEIKL